MRKKVVIGNWKMNTQWGVAQSLTSDVLHALPSNSKSEVWLAPPALYTASVVDAVANSSIKVAVQDVSAHGQGAFTGELSADMVVSVGGNGSIIGHSERRQYHQETNETIAQKIHQCITQNLTAILCIGETLTERQSGEYLYIIEHQLRDALRPIHATDMDKVMLAYEPVWAIGTGETATADQAQEVHSHLRHVLTAMFHESIALQTPILYGGSVKPNNALEIFSMPDVDGGLIGGAALNGEDFVQITQSFA